MHSDTYEAYKANRAKGYRAKDALLAAKYSRDHANVWDWRNDRATYVGDDVPDTIEVALRVEFDDSPDTSWLGTFSDSYSDGAIVASEDSRCYRYFNPAIAAAEHRVWLSRAGYSRHAAYLKANEYVKRDMEMAREYESYVVYVTVSIDGIEVGADVLGGVDVGDDDREHAIEHIVYEHGMIENAMSEAREAIAKIGKVAI